MRPTEQLAAELGSLVRGLRDLGAALRVTGGPALELAAVQVLARVGDEGPLRLSTLAERLCLDLSTVSRQVPALEAQGWLVREPDPTDRRATLLRLTPEGQEALRQRRAAHARALEDALPDWTDDEVAALAASLARLNADVAAHRSALASGDAAPPAPPTSRGARPVPLETAR